MLAFLFGVVFPGVVAYLGGVFSEDQLRRTIEIKSKSTLRLQEQLDKLQEYKTNQKLNDGRMLSRRIERAIGSIEKPMTDADLERKFLDLADGVIPAAQAKKVMDTCWSVERLDNVGELAKSAAAA